jgi:hypothetical protein
MDLAFISGMTYLVDLTRKMAAVMGWKKSVMIAMRLEKVTK